MYNLLCVKFSTLFTMTSVYSTSSAFSLIADLNPADPILNEISGGQSCEAIKLPVALE